MIVSEAVPAPYAAAIRTLQKEFVRLCCEVFGDLLVAILAKGSAVKGGFIPGLSDLDLHVYLDDEAFEFEDFLKPELGFQFQARMDPLLHRYDLGGGPIQVILLNVARPKEWSGPLPGTYVLLYGESCPEPPPDAEGMLRQDWQNLAQPRYGYGLIHSLLDKPNEQLADYVRRLNAAVTPTFYRTLSLVTRDPLRVWSLTKWEVLQELSCLEREDTRELAALGREFYELAPQWAWLRSDPEHSRRVLRLGYRILALGRQLAIADCRLEI